jgi:hypothetical protein
MIKRLSQLAALSLGGGMFNGNIEITAHPLDVTKLTFNADIKVFTGDTNAPFVEYSPCDDNGKLKVFANIDDMITWVKGVYVDILSVKVIVASFELITSTFKVIADPLKEAIAKKAFFLKKKALLDDNLVMANLDVTRYAALGYNLPTAHPAEKIIYDENVVQRDAIVAIQTYYANRVAFYQGIITP